MIVSCSAQPSIERRSIEGEAMFKTIVLGLDGSDSSDRALQHATVLAKEQGSSVRVVHVIELVAGRSGGVLHLDEDKIKAKIERQTRELVDAGIDAELELYSSIAGGPAHVIAEVAERSGADVIITGTRGHTAAAGILLGSVAHRLLHVSHRPLLIIPTPVESHLVGETVPDVAVAHPVADTIPQVAVVGI
jgi:nucleotide-binding universal stress UspA family protein